MDIAGTRDAVRLRDLLARLKPPPTPAAGEQLHLLGMPPPPRVDRRFLGACPSDHPLRLQVQEIERQGRRARYRVVVGPLLGQETPFGYGEAVTVPCPVCGKRARLEAVAGAYSKEAPCNALCMGARGPVCDCRCAGVNHGRWFG